MRCSGQRLLSTWRRFRVNHGAPANINARISHLAESKSAGLEYADAAAGAAAGQHLTANELLRCEIPEGQSLERHQYRTHLRLSRRKIESAAHWNHHESSTGIIDFQSLAIPMSSPMLEM